MGRLQAEEMAVWQKDRHQGLIWHLQSNHYPPIGIEFVPVAEKAIDKVIQGEYNFSIKMPNNKTLTAGEIVEGLHLEPWVESDSEFIEEV